MDTGNRLQGLVPEPLSTTRQDVRGRPRFHLSGAGWINDPHGITVHGGRYHADYHFVPGRTSWDLGCRWGHAIGLDMLSLVELPPVLAPGDGEDGIWTGSVAVDESGAAAIFSTAVDAGDLDHERIRVATPIDDGWVDWRKGDVVAHSPNGLALTTFRDPAVRRDPDAWRMVVGGSTADAGVALSASGSEVEVSAASGVRLATIAATSDEVLVRIGDGEWRMPRRGATSIIVDGPALEVVNGAGLFAAPLVDDGGDRIIDGVNGVRRLER